MGKMVFADGRVKEGFFENNVYKGKTIPTNFNDMISDTMSNSSYI
jgi:hypothetical protein